MVDEKQVNPRIKLRTFEYLEQDAKNQDLSINSMASRILEKYYTLIDSKSKRGDITIMREVFREVIKDKEDQKSFEDSAKIAGLRIITEMKMQVDDLDLNEIHRRLIEWHKYNQFKVQYFDNEHRRKYIIKHELGIKWSEYECLMYQQIFRLIGATIISASFDELSLTIEIGFTENA